MVSKTTSQSAGGVKTNPNNSKIKQIVETTRCTRAEAEEALKEAGGELESACSWVLDHGGDNVWTEKKSRKVTNKKPESGAPAEVKPETKKAESGAATGQVKQDRPPRTENGRGGERRGGGGGNFRGGNRGPGNRPGWNKKPEAGAPATSTEVKSETKKDESSDAAPATAGSGEVKQERPPRNDNNGRGERRGGGPYRGGNHRGSGHRPAWKGGQVFTRSDAKPASPPATTETTQSPPVAPAPVQPEVIKTAAGPLSFAAVCAAGVKKPEPSPSPATTTTQASPGVSPDANLVSSEPQQIVETTPSDADKETSAELEAATPEVHADDEALPEASGELEAANPEIQTEIEAEETTADEPKVSTPDHLEQVGQNAWAEKFYIEKAAPPVVEIRRPILDYSEIQTVIFAPSEKPAVKAAAVPTYTPPVSTPSTPAVFSNNGMPQGYAHSSYYHPPPTQQVQQQQQQPVLSQAQQQQMYNPLYASYVPPPPGLSGPNNHMYHNQQYPNMHYGYMQMGHQMYPTGNAANTNQVQNRRYDTNQHSGAAHNNLQQHHYAWNT